MVLIEDMEGQGLLPLAASAQRDIHESDIPGPSSILVEYSQDAESVQRFGEDPAELRALLQDASGRIEQARTLLSTGEIWKARILAAAGRLEGVLRRSAVVWISGRRLLSANREAN
jgi:hypothetical protein